MCRLFGMSSGSEPMRATFWLLDAPDSLAQQSRREPDGTGVGTFDADGTPHVAKQALAAYEDAAFAREARELKSRTFVAHIRFASTGEVATRNCHPFEQEGRLLAHNGVIQGLGKLEAEIGERYGQLVRGESDSERFFALVTRRIDEHDGNVGAGLTSATRWVAANIPLYALNIVLTTPTDMWALRYPETHGLFMLQREAGGHTGTRHLEEASAAGTVRVRSGDLTQRPAVVIASEPMDEHPAWTALAPGELLHVGPNLEIERSIIIEGPPAHRLTLADLDPRAAESQHPAPSDAPPAAAG